MMDSAVTPKFADILLAEDSESDIDIICEIMEESKIANTLHVVKNGMEVMRYLRGEGDYANKPRPDILFLDLNMPEMDGRQVLAAIRADPALTDLPVVILTSSKAEEDVAKSYNLHANCYVIKPLGVEEFMKVVRELVHFWFALVILPPKKFP